MTQTLAELILGALYTIVVLMIGIIAVLGVIVRLLKGKS